MTTFRPTTEAKFRFAPKKPPHCHRFSKNNKARSNWLTPVPFGVNKDTRSGLSANCIGNQV